MVEKISPKAVAIETLELIRQQKKLLFAVGLLLFAAVLPEYWMPDASEAMPLWLSIYLGVTFILDAVVYISLYHYLLHCLRGRTVKLIPDGLFKKIFHTFWRTIAAFLLCFALGILPAFLINVVAELFIPVNTPTFVYLFFYLILITVCFGIPMARYGFSFIALTVNEDPSFIQSWHISKGHSVALIIYVAPFFGFIAVPHILSAAGIGPFASAPVLSQIILQPLLIAYGLFLASAGVVWYERLTIRNALIEAETEKATKRVLASLQEKREAMGIRDEE